MNGDTNGDGSITISDIPALLLQVLLLPGDAVIRGLLTWLPGVARFLELSENSYGGPVAIGLSIALWLLALVAAGVALNAIRNLDSKLTALVAAGFIESRRQVRVLRRRLAVGISQRFRDRDDDSVQIEQLKLEPLEQALLRCLTNIDDGAVLSIEEIAAQLNGSLPQVRAADLRLRELKLIETGTDTYAKREGLRITTAGQMALIAH